MDFKDSPNAQDASPTFLFVYDTTIGGWRSARAGDFGSAAEGAGLFDIPTGQRTVSVTGLSMQPPAYRLMPRVTLMKPSISSDHFTTNIVGSSISTSGFDVELSAPASQAGYKLAYEVGRDSREYSPSCEAILLLEESNSDCSGIYRYSGEADFGFVWYSEVASGNNYSDVLLYGFPFSWKLGLALDVGSSQWYESKAYSPEDGGWTDGYGYNLPVECSS